MIKTRTESSDNDKVIYQYKLVKRIRLHPVMATIYWTIPALWVLFQTLFQDFALFVSGVIAFIFWQLVYYLGTFLLLYRHDDDFSYFNRYKWHFRVPWFGFLPSSGVPVRQFQFVQIHLFLFGFFLTASAYLWLPDGWIVTICFFHIWWMLPRLYISLALRPPSDTVTIVSVTAKHVDFVSV